MNKIIYWQLLAEWYKKLEKHLPTKRQLKERERALRKAGLIK